MSNIKQTVADIDRLVKEWDYDANNQIGLFPDKVSAQCNKYAFWKCKYGHKWKAKINNRYNGRGCPECSKRLHTSFPEQAVYFYIKKVFPDAINSYKDIFDNGMELDIYIPSLKTGIEYDGIVWHGDKHLHKEQIKYKICKDNGILLIRLKENREHYRNNLNVADSIILVGRPYTSGQISYSYLNKAIRQLLFSLFDYDFSDLFRQKSTEESILELTEGPKVKTDVDVKRDKEKIYENYLVSLEKNSLASVLPQVAKMWHPTKNGNLRPDMFPPHSNERVWWKGECGHEWDDTISVMARGTGCPYCSGNRVLVGFNDLRTTHPKLAEQWNPIKNEGKTPEMFTQGSGYRAVWHCEICGQDWKAAICNRTGNDRGCPYCAHQKPIKGKNDFVTLCPDLMKEWDWDKNVKIDPSDYMPGSNKKVWWKCQKCGFSYQALISNRTKGTGCRRCAGQILIKGVNDLETLYPDIAKQWDYEKNGKIKPSDVFPKSNKPYSWICSLGHRWDATPNARTSGTGCPVCSGNRVLAGFNDLATTHPEIAKNWDYEMNKPLLPTQISKGHKNKVYLKCPKCGKSYDTLIGNVIKGYGKCPRCSEGKTRAKYVHCIETDEFFKTLKEAAMSIGKVDYRQIHMCCKGRCKTAGGLHWEYAIKPEE